MPLPISWFTILLGAATAAGLECLRVVWRYQRKQRLNGTTPGLKLVVANTTLTVIFLPAFRIPFTSNWHFNIGGKYWFTGTNSRAVFETHGQDIISAVSVDAAPLCYLIADAEATQEVVRNPHRFPKPVRSYKPLEVFGRNVVTTEGEDWRIHRKITAPSFNENSNRLVWEEAVLAMRGLFDTWRGRESVECSDFTDITVQIALIIICGAAFGMRVPWSEEAPPSGHQLSFKTAMELVTSGLMMKVGVPDILRNLTRRGARVSAGFEELKKFIIEMINDRANHYQDYSDLFSNLLAANENDSEGLKLTDEELSGNIFIFLMAGHETTAHTLAFATAFLALYPDVQEKLYEHVKETVADPTGVPTYNEVPRLTYATAVFSEALRLFPSVIVVPKIASEDTTLRTTDRKGEPVVVPIPKGSYVHLLPTALHQNPKYWDAPGEFKPERFLGNWPRHAFAPFSLGPRACIGRRFAEIEGTVVLSMLVRNYRVSITEDPKFVNETSEQRKARVLACYNLTTLTPERIPITLTRRH